MKRSLPTRLLHLPLAAAIIHQLVVTLFMRMPTPAGRSGDLGFELHEIVGLATLGVLLVFWLWILARRGEYGFSVLIPWFSSVRRRAVIADLGLHWGAMRKRQFPLPAEESPFASAVHGLGLLVATSMAVTGAIVFTAMGPDGSVSGFGATALDVHRAFANLMWAYLIGHASAALLHQMNGHRVLERIFTTQTRHTS